MLYTSKETAMHYLQILFQNTLLSFFVDTNFSRYRYFFMQIINVNADICFFNIILNGKKMSQFSNHYRLICRKRLPFQCSNCFKGMVSNFSWLAFGEDIVFCFLFHCKFPVSGNNQDITIFNQNSL